MILAVWALLFYAAWARGGTYVPMQAPLPWLGGLILAAAAIAVWRTPPDAAARRAALVRVVRDPLIYLGLAFLALLVLQGWNAGRIRVMDLETGRWSYTPPRHPGWPSAVTRADAAEMLRWFFPGWAAVLALRTAGLRPPLARLLLTGLVVNAAALSVFGIAQYLSGARALYGRFPLTSHFFASFGYANHAAAFFVLLLALAAGLLLHELQRVAEGREPRRVALAIVAIGSGLCLAGAHLSQSRLGMILAWGLTLPMVPYGIARLWRVLTPAQRVNAGVASAVVLAMLAMALAGAAHRAFLGMHGEWKGLSPLAEGRGRTFQIRAALDMLADQPAFGVGGWGYRYLLPDHVSDADTAMLGEGRANAHCDPVQFLAEFGVAGAALLVAAVLVLLCPLVRALRRGAPLVLTGALGLGATGLHSLVDLPFRSPAILYHWLAILAVLPLTLTNQPAKGRCP